MLTVGSLISFEGRRGVVRRIDRRTRLATIETEQGYVELPATSDQDVDRCTVLSNITDWPVAAVPNGARLGRLVSISHRGQPLVLFQDYVPTTVGTRTTAVFLSPTLGLSVGDVLIGGYEKGLARIGIRRTPLTVAERLKTAEDERKAKERLPSTAYDRILDDDEPY